MKSSRLPVFGSIPSLLACLERGRRLRYGGEAVTEWEHALQTAALAERAGAPAWLVTAALLHDIGHLAVGAGIAPGLDDRHEQLGVRMLAGLFGPRVTGPIALHVQAKRCLVALPGDYAATLSDDSRRSLALQGGPMEAAEVRAFRALPGAEDALRLRCWDDLAKRADAPVQPIEHYLPALQACVNT